MVNNCGTKAFINSQGETVSEALESFVAVHSNLSLIKDISVVYRSDIAEIKNSRVALISGGGSGHEPAHIGYIGTGMLSAVVCGQVFASPNAYQVYGAIEKVAGEKGVLLIVKNYTGDRCQFGRAMNKARANGIKVEMLIVEDDCSIPQENVSRVTGRRGLAGTVFYHKILGAFAERGADLHQLKSLGEELSKCVGTVGVSFSKCNIPGSAIQDDLDSNIMQVGLGIHGEPGFTEVVAEHSNSIAGRVVEKLLNSSYLSFDENEVFLLVNNLGRTLPLEMSIFSRDLIKQLSSKGLKVQKCFVGTYMTALNMHGISASVLIGKKWVEFLSDPSNCIGWNGKHFKEPMALIENYGTKSVEANQDNLLDNINDILKVVCNVCDNLISSKENFNSLDRIVGDGDCGTTFERLATSVKSVISKKPPANILQLCRLITVQAETVMQGSSGAFICMLFEGIEHSLVDAKNSQLAFVEGLKQGIQSISNYGGAKVGDRTMLDSLEPAVKELEISLTNGKSVSEALKIAAKSAEIGVKKTESMKAVVGRSSYIDQQKILGHADPGAAVIAQVFRTLSLSMK